MVLANTPSDLAVQWPYSARKEEDDRTHEEITLDPTRTAGQRRHHARGLRRRWAAAGCPVLFERGRLRRRVRHGDLRIGEGRSGAEVRRGGAEVHPQGRV